MNLTVRWLFSASVLFTFVPFADAEEIPSVPITLKRSIHFIASDGNDVVVPAGTYRIEQAAEGQLRLLADSSQQTIAIQATATTHKESVSSPLALAITEEGQQDELHLVLLLPNGGGFDAVGTFSGTRSRAAVSSALSYSQVQYAVGQFNASALQIVPVPRTPPAAPAAKAMPPAESIETSGPVKLVTWNYLSMYHPEIVAQALADVQASKQPRTSIAGLASDVELNEMLKTNWSAEVTRLNAMAQAGVTPRGVMDQFTAVATQKSAVISIVKALPIALPPRNLGSVWAGQRAITIVSFTAPADGYVEGRLNLNATNRHFRIVNAIAYTGEVVRGTLAISLTVPGGQYQDVVPDPANPPAQISKAGFVSILAKKGQRIDFTIAFEPVGLGMTPVGDNEATLQLSGAMSSDINILSNAPTTPWLRTASIHARFEGINFGVIGAIDNTTISVFYDGTPCGRIIPVPASITFFNAEQLARSIAVTAESLGPALHVQPFTVSLGPGERKQVAIPLQIDSCPNQGFEYTGTIKYAYPGVARRADFGVTLYPEMYHWESYSKSVGSCDYSWDIYIHPDGTTSFAYSLRNRNLISEMQLDLRFSVLGQEIGRGVLMDGQNTVHTKFGAYTISSLFVRDNYLRMLTASAQAGLRCHTPGS